MNKHKWLAAFAIIAILAVIGYITVRHLEPEYVYMPPKEKVISKEKRVHGYDLWGAFTPDKPAPAEEGVVKVDDRLLDLGRETFYKETFGNEVFLTDIIGLLDGPITAANMTKAIAGLKGKGTTNLRIELAETVKVGGKIFKKARRSTPALMFQKGHTHRLACLSNTLTEKSKLASAVRPATRQSIRKR